VTRDRGNGTKNGKERAKTRWRTRACARTEQRERYGKRPNEKNGAKTNAGVNRWKIRRKGKGEKRNGRETRIGGEEGPFARVEGEQEKTVAGVRWEKGQSGARALG